LGRSGTGMGSLVMPLKRLLAHLIYGGTTRLRPYEQACVERLKALLPHDGVSLLEGQLSTVELIQRFSNDRLVLVHFAESSKGSVPLFPNRSEEFRAARVQLRPMSGGAVTADVVFHVGKLSSIEYSRAPRKALEAGFTIEAAKLLEDLMAEAPTDLQPSEVQPGSLLAEIGRHGRAEHIIGPAPEKTVAAFLSMVGAVPADYGTLLSETNGFSAGEWRFMGTRARRVILPNRTLWLVAETSEFALCFEESSADPSVLLYDQIEDECRAMGEAFVPALLEAMSSTHRES